MKLPIALVASALVFGVAGCSGSPSAPSPPPSPLPTIASIVPAAGTTGGGTPVTITGTGFSASAKVTLDGVPGTAVVVSGFQTTQSIQFATPVHPAGAVDLVITNPDGQVIRRVGAYTYAPPESFEFNGSWAGMALAHPELQGRRPLHSDMEIAFTIAGNRLISMTCGSPETLTFSPPPSIANGEFSSAANGITLTGRIVSDGSAIGTIDTEWCPKTRWSAARR